MSEELSTSSTKSQNFTQEGCTSSSDLNFSLNLHIHVTAAPALQVALKNLQVAFEKIAAALAMQEEKIAHPMQEVVFQGLNEEQVDELMEKEVVDPGMTESAKRKHKTVSAPKKYMKVKWTNIPKHPHLKYRDDGGKLILNYAGSIVETTWQQVENTARLDQKYWAQEIAKILGNRQASTRKAAVSLFLKLIEKGEVSRVTISQFNSDESTEVSV